MKPSFRIELEPVDWPDWAIASRTSLEHALARIPVTEANRGMREVAERSLNQLYVMFPFKRAIMIPCDTDAAEAPSESEQGDPLP